MEPNRKIIQEYQRFYLLYRQSNYLEDVTELLRNASNDLAEYEFIVGEYYFSQKAYDSAITRYLYLLKDFPNTQRAHVPWGASWGSKWDRRDHTAGFRSGPTMSPEQDFKKCGNLWWGFLW